MNGTKKSPFGPNRMKGLSEAIAGISLLVKRNSASRFLFVESAGEDSQLGSQLAERTNAVTGLPLPIFIKPNRTERVMNERIADGCKGLPLRDQG